MVPLSWPAIYATAIITAQYIWNDFSGRTSISPARAGWSRPLALSLCKTRIKRAVGAIFAGLSILVIPVAVFFVFVQRQLMEGLGFAGISR